MGQRICWYIYRTRLCLYNGRIKIAKHIFLNTKFQSFKDDGSVNASGTVAFYEPDGAFSTFKTTFTDSTLGTDNSNTITLDSAGRADVWMNGDYDAIEKDSDGNTIDSIEKLNPETVSTVSNAFNLIINGSMEADTDNNSLPDSWDITEFTGSTNAVDSTTQTHGNKSMKFTSIGNGGATITSTDFFEVKAGTTLSWSFDLKVTDAGIRILAQFLWYDASKVALGSPSTDLYDEATANPTSFENINGVVAVPSTALYAKFKFWGAHSSDSTSKAESDTLYNRTLLRPPNRKIIHAFIS